LCYTFFLSLSDDIFQVYQYRVFLYALICDMFNPLNAELNPICHPLALLGAHHILYVSGIRVKSHSASVLKYDITVILTNCVHSFVLH